MRCWYVKAWPMENGRPEFRALGYAEFDRPITYMSDLAEIWLENEIWIRFADSVEEAEQDAKESGTRFVLRRLYDEA